MQNSPPAGHALITEVLALIRKGSSVHRCRIANHVLTFDNPHVQGLKIATDQFKQTPSPQTFENIKTAIKHCKDSGIDSYEYKQIDDLIESIDELATQPPSPRNTI